MEVAEICQNSRKHLTNLNESVQLYAHSLKKKDKFILMVRILMTDEQIILALYNYILLFKRRIKVDSVCENSREK